MDNPFRDVLPERRAERQRLMRILREKGIRDEETLLAMASTPREVFLSDYSENAYDDNALPIECGQTISQPYTVAYMTELLGVKPGVKVLEIGTGSGYQAFILYMMGALVYSIERVTTLYMNCRVLFQSNGIGIQLLNGDGTLGWPEHAPFDRIIITAAAPEIPHSLLAQLAVGGRIVAPVGDKGSQQMYVVDRLTEKEYRTTKRNNFRFVPLIGLEGWES